MKTAWLVSLMCAVLVAGGVAAADDVYPPPWRGMANTLTATWDSWPDGTPDWWLDIPPDSWVSHPSLPYAPVANLWGGAWIDRDDTPGLGRYPTVVQYADWEVEFVVPNFDNDNPYKDVWIQITYYPWTADMWAGFGVDFPGMQGSSGEQLEDLYFHPDGWITETWSMQVWPNPDE